MNEQKQQKEPGIRISIRYKMIFYAVVLVLMTVAISTYITVRTETKVLTSKRVYLGKRIAKNIAFGAEKAFTSSNWTFAEKVLDESIRTEHGEVIYAKIVTPNGKVYMANDRSFCGDIIDPDFLVDQERTLTDHFFPERAEYGILVVRPAMIGNERWHVMVGLSSKQIKATIRRLIFHNLMSSSYAVLLSAIVSFVLAKSICKPIIGLTRAAKTISNGNLEHHVPVNTKDEVGALAKAFNDMATELRESYAHLEENVQELGAEKELLSITLDGMTEGLIAVDADKRIILFNTVAENLSGWEFKEVEAEPLDKVFQIIHEQTGKPVESVIDKALQSGKIEHGSQYDTLVSRDNSQHPVFISAAPVLKSEDAVIRAVIVFRDASRERELGRMKTDFTSSVSHELRTPLTSIKAYTATILRDPNMPEDTKRQFLAIIDEESNRLTTLVEDLLEVSRIDSGKAKFERAPMDVAAVIEKVLVALQPLADKKSIRLETDVGDGLPELQADKSRIESLITNLVNNAIKFTPEQGKVFICAEAAGNEMVMRVSDTGMGIPEEALSKIFDRFYRVHRPGKQIQGTGLGLGIVKETVEMHGGRIEVESKVDQGTTFTVFLPLTADPKTEVPLPTEACTK